MVFHFVKETCDVLFVVAFRACADEDDEDAFGTGVVELSLVMGGGVPKADWMAE